VSYIRSVGVLRTDQRLVMDWMMSAACGGCCHVPGHRTSTGFEDLHYLYVKWTFKWKLDTHTLLF